MYLGSKGHVAGFSHVAACGRHNTTTEMNPTCDAGYLNWLVYQWALFTLEDEKWEKLLWSSSLHHHNHRHQQQYRHVSSASELSSPSSSHSTPSSLSSCIRVIPRTIIICNKDMHLLLKWARKAGYLQYLLLPQEKVRYTFQVLLLNGALGTGAVKGYIPPVATKAVKLGRRKLKQKADSKEKVHKNHAIDDWWSTFWEPSGKLCVECVCKHFCCWIPSHQVNGNLMHLFMPCHRWPNSRRLQSQQSQQSRHAKWLLLGFQGDSWQLQHFFLCEYMARCSRMTTGYIMIYWWKGICWRLCTKAGYPSKCADEIHRPQRRWQAKASRTGLHGPAVSFCRTFLIRRIIGAWDPAASDARCIHGFPQERKMICC